MQQLSARWRPLARASVTDRYILSYKATSMVKIRGTLCMQSHILVLPATTKFSGKSFVFKKSVALKGLPKVAVTGLGAGVLDPTVNKNAGLVHAKAPLWGDFGAGRLP